SSRKTRVRKGKRNRTGTPVKPGSFGKPAYTSGGRIWSRQAGKAANPLAQAQVGTRSACNDGGERITDIGKSRDAGDSGVFAKEAHHAYPDLLTGGGGSDTWYLRHDPVGSAGPAVPPIHAAIVPHQLLQLH